MYKHTKMRTIEIKTSVKNPDVINYIKEAKTKKKAIHTILAEGIPASQIPENLRISLI